MKKFFCFILSFLAIVMVCISYQIDKQTVSISKPNVITETELLNTFLDPEYSQFQYNFQVADNEKLVEEVLSTDTEGKTSTTKKEFCNNSIPYSAVYLNSDSDSLQTIRLTKVLSDRTEEILLEQDFENGIDKTYIDSVYVDENYYLTGKLFIKGEDKVIIKAVKSLKGDVNEYTTEYTSNTDFSIDLSDKFDSAEVTIIKVDSDGNEKILHKHTSNKIGIYM